jgi:hypothetical protein
MHTAPVAELHFRREAVEIDLVVGCAGRLPDREKALHRLSLLWTVSRITAIRPREH